MSVDPELLDRALTHRSYAYEQGGLPTNERLEFLGDSVLGLVVTEHLFVSYPDLSEGQLAKLRAAVVNSRALADVARDLDLGAVVHLGRGEESTGGRDKSSILADTMEAVIGAVFLQHGIDAARGLRAPPVRPADGRRGHPGRRAWTGRPACRRSPRSPVSGCPFYEVVESGPDHAKTFQAMVHIDDQRYGPGAGRNKKEAEQNAAAFAFAALKGVPAALPRRVPELPEVEVVRRGLAAGITGRQIADRPGAASPAGPPPPPGRSRLRAPADRPHVRRTPAPRQVPLAAVHRRRRGAGPPGDERPVPARPLRRPVGPQHPGAGQLRRRRARAAVRRPADVRRAVPVARRRGTARRGRPHRARPVRSRVRPGRRGRATAGEADRHQAGPARPAADLGDRQHLRRRGAVGGPDALRPADPGLDPGPSHRGGHSPRPR